MIKNKLLLFLILSLCGCSTVASQSPDGRTLGIRGSGSAKFENGATIEGGSFFPKFPNIEIDN